MWSEEVLLVELVKSDRGLGFSILDYQVINCCKLNQRQALMFGVIMHFVIRKGFLFRIL